MNQRELDVLNILWETDSPMSLADILAARPDLIKSTVAAILAKLLREKLIQIEGIAYSGKVLCRTYRPTELSREKALDSVAKDYNNVCNIVPRTELLASILRLDRDKEKAKEEIAQIRALLDEIEKKYNQDT